MSLAYLLESPYKCLVCEHVGVAMVFNVARSAPDQQWPVHWGAAH